MTADKSISVRIRELDALRGIAAFGVLAYHYTVHFDNTYGLMHPLHWNFELGKYGVHLFFMISGFVIFMTLERTKHSLDFAVSRFSRLFPAYWVAMGITLAFVAFAGLPGQEVTGRDVVINLSMMTDFLNAKEIDGSYWTLQIELFFYAQMFFWYTVGGLKKIRWVVTAWLVLAVIYGIESRLGLPFSYTLREILIVRFIPFFASGIMLYRAYDKRDPVAVTLIFLLVAYLSIWMIWSWKEAMVLAVCSLVFWLFIYEKLAFLTMRPFVFLGTISYTTYLLHQDIGFILIANLESSGISAWASVIIATVVVLLMATILSKTIERPAMRAIRSQYKKYRQIHMDNPAGTSI